VSCGLLGTVRYREAFTPLPEILVSTQEETYMFGEPSQAWVVPMISLGACAWIFYEG